jgi:hypothetical protein
MIMLLLISPRGAGTAQAVQGLGYRPVSRVIRVRFLTEANKVFSLDSKRFWLWVVTIRIKGLLNFTQCPIFKRILKNRIWEILFLLL